MSVAPNAGIVDFSTFLSPVGGQDGIQGQVPAPLASEAGYILSTSGWISTSSLVGVSSFSAGTTGLTPNTATTGAVTLAGILNPASGGTGVNNGTNTLTVSANSGTLSFTNASTTLTIANTGSISGTNTGDVTLATDSGLGFTSGQTGLALGTPTTITSSSTNAVTTNTHSHAITASLALIGDGTAQNQLPVTGATPFTPVWTTATGTGAPVLATSPTFVTSAIFPAGTAAAPSITFSGDTNNGIFSPSTDQIGFTTAGSQRMVVDASGNVGIGITAPNAKFNVVGGGAWIEADDSSAEIQVRRASDNTGGPFAYLNKSRGTTAARTIVASGDTVGTVFFRGYDGATFQNAASIASVVDATPGAGDMPGRLVFSTTADGTATVTERMRIDNAGNVGIGISSYTARVHVVGAQPTSVTTVNGTAASSVLTVLGGTGGTTTIATTGVGGAGGAYSLTGGTGGVASSAATSSSGGAGGNMLLLGGTGGAAQTIGTTRNGGRGGSVSIYGGTGGAASGGTFNSSGNGGNVLISSGAGGATNGTDGEIYFLVGGVTAATVASNKYLGIATGSPTNEVTINGSLRAYGAFDENTVNDGVYAGITGSGGASPRLAFVYTGQTTWQIDVDGSSRFRWYIPGYNMMWLNKAAGSNSGVLTLLKENATHWSVEPSFMYWGNDATVDIQFLSASAAGTAGKSMRIWANDTTAGGTNIAGGSVVLNAGLGTGTGASNLVFQTGAAQPSGTTLQTLTEAMRIVNTQDVCIGTTSTSAQSRVRVVKAITPTATGVINGFLADISATGWAGTPGAGGSDFRTFNLLNTTTGTTNFASQYGSFVNASNNLTSGTVTNHYAYAASPRIIGGGSSTTFSGYNVLPLFSSTSTGSVTNYYGFYSQTINYQAGATGTITTRSAGIYLDALYNATWNQNAYGVYQAGADDKNYFAGNVGLNVTVPRTALHIQNPSGSVNAAVDVANTFILMNNATAQVNTGGVHGKIAWTGYNRTTQSAYIESGWSSGSFDVAGYLAFATSNGTPVERLRITEAGDVTFADAVNMVFNATTGTKIGTATTQKIAFYNATPIVRPSAYTQTFSTANKTMAARTAAALTNNTGGTVSTTLAAITAGATYSQADMVAVKNALASLADQVNKQRTDDLDTAEVVNAVIDDLQALGLVG